MYSNQPSEASLKAKLDQAVANRLAQEAKQAQADKEAKASKAILDSFVAKHVALAIATGIAKPGLFKLHLEAAQDAQRAYLELAYDLLSAPLYALERASGKLYWHFKGYSDVTALQSAIEDHIGNRYMDTPGYFAPLLAAFVDNSGNPELSYEQGKRFAVDDALAANQAPSVPDGLTFTDQASLCIAMGWQVI
ncbi:MAG TPA: hypothetical protein V6C84_28490 [Coleofasciculaceae cyanobacterium]|jgi:hypothetical protein